MPGTQGGAGDFTLDARYLVKHDRDLQVWAIDRRTQALEDTSVFAEAENGQVSLQQAFDYYLGWIFNGGNPAKHFQFRDPNADPYAREWGMAVALNDARAVVLKARAHGRRQVVLGGHSLGASLTVAYAAWDFNGHPGWKDLEGLVLIDGGLLGSFDAYDLAQAQKAVADLQTSDPFLDLLGVGHPRGGRAFRRGRRALRRAGPDRLRHDPAVVPAVAAPVQPGRTGDEQGTSSATPSTAIHRRPTSACSTSTAAGWQPRATLAIGSMAG